MIDRLPRDSHYVAELADDDEIAARMPPGDDGPQPPRLTEFGPVIEHLAAVRDLLGVLVALQAAPPGKRPQPPPPVARPVTAADRARQRIAEERRTAMAAQLWPGGNGDGGA